MSERNSRSPLRHAELRRIVAGYTVNRLGTWFGFIALAVVVFDHTHDALAVASLLLASQVLPALVVPALVARVEASTKRGELTRLYLFEAITTGLLIVVVRWHFSLPAILVLVALDGTAALAASALLRAAAARSARAWVRLQSEQSAQEPSAEDFTAAEQRANAAINIGFATTFTLGPALAGVVVPTLGVSAALLIDLCSFVICGLLLIDLRPYVEDAESESVRARIKGAWEYIASARTLRLLLITQAIAFIFFEFSPPIEVAYAKVSLHAGDEGYGVLLGVWGLGVALGSAVFARSIESSLRLLLSASTFAVGFAYLGWWLAPSLGVAAAVGFVGGVGNGVQWAALISAVQRLTPESLQGRLMSAVEALGAIFPAFGYVIGSAITSATTPRIALLVAGIGVTLATIAFARIPILAIASRSAEREGGMPEKLADYAAPTT
ncbi:MAG TPA: MFS transporter [Solirubrobacteraceae bacterium]|nr:MFS transporter [Solirubrobacteraceae bacterium]